MLPSNAAVRAALTRMGHDFPDCVISAVMGGRKTYEHEGRTWPIVVRTREIIRAAERNASRDHKSAPGYLQKSPQ